jgi:hypothetical protein
VRAYKTSALIPRLQMVINQHKIKTNKGKRGKKKTQEKVKAENKEE